MIREPLAGLNAEALTLRVQAPERWQDIEARLRGRGLTLGWAPAASPLETLGELLEARAAGLRSALYGDVAANCIAVEAVLANGTPVSSRVVPRSAAGPDWKHVLLGGHGVTGRISAATIRVHRIPERVIPLSYDFSSDSAALRALATVLHRGAIPAVAALVPTASGARLLLTLEGQAGLTQARAAITARIVSEAGGMPAGEAPVTAWIDQLEAGGEAAPARLLLRPTLRVDGGFEALPAMLEVVRSYPDLRYCVTHLRHAAAALLVEAPVIDEDARAGLIRALEAAGGRPASSGPVAGPLGARIVPATAPSAPGPLLQTGSVTGSPEAHGKDVS